MRQVRASNEGRLSIGGRFKGFDPEQEKAVGKADIKEEQVLAQLRGIWKSHEIAEITGALEIGLYYEMISKLGLPDYSPGDIEKLSLALEEFQDEKWFGYKAGLFLSALINRSKEKDFTVHTMHLGSPIRYLGYMNEKNITVEGDGGDFLGESMKCGGIRVKGDAGGWVGSDLCGGMIIVEGDAGHRVGHLMKGGKITVKGNADRNVGEGMEGGEIHLGRDYENIGRIEGGRIYRKGELIAGN